MGMIDQIFSRSMQSYEAQRQHEMSLLEYLELCRRDPMSYASAAERMVAAIGESQLIDTAKDPRLGRIFMNRTIKVYPAFADFFGMEDTVERIVSFFRYSAQGLEDASRFSICLARWAAEILDRRAAQAAHGANPDLCAQSRATIEPDF